VELADSSMLAAALLYEENKRVFEAQFPHANYTDEIAYLYHQQGSTSARTFLETGVLLYPKQSKKSLDLFSQVKMDFTFT
jgi:hypothetical protein